MRGYALTRDATLLQRFEPAVVHAHTGLDAARRLTRDSARQILALDVDHFKRFNDSFGHEAGDHVLKQVGAVLLRRTRVGDVASRIGGEELVVVLPRATLEDAAKKAESIRAEIGALVLTLPNKAAGPVTVSIGIAVFPRHGTSRDELMRVADAALYRAKHAGRNRSVAAE